MNLSLVRITVFSLVLGLALSQAPVQAAAASPDKITFKDKVGGESKSTFTMMVLVTTTGLPMTTGNKPYPTISDETITLTIGSASLPSGLADPKKGTVAKPFKASLVGKSGKLSLTYPGVALISLLGLDTTTDGKDKTVSADLKITADKTGQTQVVLYNKFVSFTYSVKKGVISGKLTIDTTVLKPVVLGQTSHFAVLAGAAVTNVPASAITGDVGVSPAAETFITGFSQTDGTGNATSPQVTGFLYAANMADPTPAMLTQAKGDLTIAYNDAAGRTPVPAGTFLDPGTGNLAGLTLVPGLYKFTGEAIATTDFTLAGGANDVWIFQIASDLNISNGVHVTLAGGAQAKNIFWQVGTQATLGTTVIFHGTIVADASITMNTGATLNGRALAFSGTVALGQNIITVPAP